jgi:hypothetical protein
LAKPFAQYIDNRLENADTATEKEEWDTAKKALADAEAVWSRWREAKSQWIAQLAYAQKLLGALPSNSSDGEESDQVAGLRRRLEQTIEDSPAKKTPLELNKDLDDLHQQIRQYAKVAGAADLLRTLSSNQAVPETDECRAAVSTLLKRLDTVTLEDESGLDSVLKDVQTACSDWQSKAVHERTGPDVKRLIVSRLQLNTLVSMGSPPSVQVSTPENADGKWASHRLACFRWLCWALALFLIAGTGFQEVYVKNPVFGQSPWMDYFAVFLWGFGAEATRASVTSTIRSWDQRII